MNTPIPALSKGRPKTFECPSCGGTVTIKAVGVTITVVCSQCSSLIDVTNPHYRILAKANEKILPTLLELGAQGQLAGIKWEVIGYMRRSDGGDVYEWDEYLLYNPYQGFRFLVQADGHWNFIKVLRRNVHGAGSSKKVFVEDTAYTLFQKGGAIVKYVKGEFYWRVRKGERTRVADYIAPPYMLCAETNNTEINVSLGEYVEPFEVERAFNITGNMPYRKGVGANQPSPYQGKLAVIWLAAAVACLFVFLIQALTIMAADDADVYETKISVSPAQKEQTFATPSFNLPKEGNVMIASHSPVNNNWVELELSLVSEQSNKEYVLIEPIEYYHGYEGGEYWSEGSQGARTFLSKVPSGDYRLLVGVDAGAFRRYDSVDVAFKIKRDVPNWSNAYLIIALLAIYPVFAGWRNMRFETKRWEESNLSNFFKWDNE